jgi:hypothetical protein
MDSPNFIQAFRESTEGCLSARPLWDDSSTAVGSESARGEEPKRERRPQMAPAPAFQKRRSVGHQFVENQTVNHNNVTNHFRRG